MARVIGIGVQDFESLRKDSLFYVDKTGFLTSWWFSKDQVTLVTRPRRFGKTLMMKTVERFFSCHYDEQADLFGDLKVWQDLDMRSLAGSMPVVFMSFGDLKPADYAEAKVAFSDKLKSVIDKFSYIYDSDKVSDDLRSSLKSFGRDAQDVAATKIAIKKLCKALYQYHGVKPLILLDEYDTLLQEAWLKGYWDSLSEFMRGWINSTFKTNEMLERGLLTGITRIGKESFFSDFNNVAVVTVTSPQYETDFGFTEAEVCAALAEYDLSDHFEEVRRWYDGFRFGNRDGIYNPWSITQFLKHRQLKPHWLNVGADCLIEYELATAGKIAKSDFERLMNGGVISARINEQISFRDLRGGVTFLWSLLLTAGYLKIVGEEPTGVYQLQLTNYEVQLGFENMIRRWFDTDSGAFNDFVIALLACDIDALNACMTQMAEESFSFFDATGRTPENFYHGFVLGMLVQLKDRFFISSNRESGYGRYDVMLEPKNPRHDDAYILEFKVRQPGREATLEETLHNAKLQITAKAYDRELVKRGIEKRRIHALGIVFDQKKVLIG